jgi:DNA-binding XRE family transcriptional regulator
VYLSLYAFQAEKKVFFLNSTSLCAYVPMTGLLSHDLTLVLETHVSDTQHQLPEEHAESKANILLRQARRERGLTQAKLAEMLHASEQTVSSWERGLHTPSLETISHLCQLFQRTPEQLGFPTENEVVPSPNSSSPSLTTIHIPPRQRESVPWFVQNQMGQNRQRMLKRVRSTWIDGILMHSLYLATLIVPGLREQPDAVENPWRLLVQESNLPPRLLPAGTRLIDVYHEIGEDLLILGEPGAGKTTLLLDLTRALLELAELHENHPIPVVFNLASWAENRQRLEDWLVEELNTKYQVPHQLGHEWMRTNQILPLLDGFDEVVTTARSACVLAINDFRREHGMLPMIVCSRRDDYTALSARLLLRTALVVLPLSQQQIDDYLSSAGEQLGAVRVALQQDETLQEMASTPLMLSTLAYAYEGMSIDEVRAKASPEERRNMVLDAYIHRVLQRRGMKKQYMPHYIKNSLGWLAAQMLEHGQTEFYVERLQPNWLKGGHEQQKYRRTVIRIVTSLQCFAAGGLAAWLKGGLKNGIVGSGNGILGLFGGGVGNSMLGWMAPGIGAGNQGGASLIIILGIVIWLVTILVGGPLPTITAQAIRHGLLSGAGMGLKAGGLTTIVAIPFFSLLGGLEYGLQYGLGIGFFLGMSAGLMYGLAAGLRDGKQAPQEKRPFQEKLVDGLFFGVSGAVSFMTVGLLLQVSHRSTLIYGAVAGFFFLLAYGFGGGSSLFPSLGQVIKPAEIVVWSWKQMARDMVSNGKKSALISLVTLISVSAVIAGVSSIFQANSEYGLRYGLVFGTISALIVGIVSMLTSAFTSGFSSAILPDDQHLIPNEGIARSGRNALIGACILAPVGGLGGGLACGVGFGLVGGLSTWAIMAMAFATMLSIMFFVIFATAYGGIAWIEHYLLRYTLWRAGYIPGNYIRFLNTASEYMLIRKVGGGYMFMHRLVLEYLADFYQSETQQNDHTNEQPQTVTV